jgi:hypothetical protein
MAWGYRRRKRIGPGVNLNVGKRTFGLSFGRRGARLSINSRGQRRASLGWKGLFWRRKI